MRLWSLSGALLGLVLATGFAHADDFSCDNRYCKHMHSCAEAVWRFDHCTGHNLDRDADGIPCENICSSMSDVDEARKGNPPGPARGE